MEVRLSPETESRLAEIAARSGKAVEDVVGDAISDYLDQDLEYIAAVEEGLEELDRGEFVEHGQVVSRIENLLR